MQTKHLYGEFIIGQFPFQKRYARVIMTYGETVMKLIHGSKYPKHNENPESTLIYSQKMQFLAGLT